MKGINRRSFLKLAGAGSAVAAAGVNLPGVSLLAGSAQASTLTFRAVAGLPAKPLPSYASYVVEGHVNLVARSGVVTKRLIAGGPEDMSAIALPGLSRIVRVTDVREANNGLHITGVVDDRSQLQRGESATVEFHVDRDQGALHTDFVGHAVELRLER